MIMNPAGQQLFALDLLASRRNQRAQTKAYLNEWRSIYRPINQAIQRMYPYDSLREKFQIHDRSSTESRVSNAQRTSGTKVEVYRKTQAARPCWRDGFRYEQTFLSSSVEPTTPFSSYRVLFVLYLRVRNIVWCVLLL
mmetsp:Transcript_12334/g.29303  ORF Transcript_12334/g.29303 Transcript_12334/m.29303 type:complete len:138 (-) Transcript_12334:837-1250(-)